MAYNITIGNKTIEITESGYNILKAILEIEFSPPTVVSFCSLGGYRNRSDAAPDRHSRI